MCIHGDEGVKLLLLLRVCRLKSYARIYRTYKETIDVITQLQGFEFFKHGKKENMTPWHA